MCELSNDGRKYFVCWNCCVLASNISEVLFIGWKVKDWFSFIKALGHQRNIIWYLYCQCISSTFLVLLHISSASIYCTKCTINWPNMLVKLKICKNQKNCCRSKIVDIFVLSTHFRKIVLCFENENSEKYAEKAE